MSMRKRLASLALRNPVRAAAVARKQRQFLAALPEPTGEGRLVVILESGFDLVNGGVLSNHSITRESRKLVGVHAAEVHLATLPGAPRLLRHTKFRNDETLSRLDELVAARRPSAVLVHVPELQARHFERWSRRIPEGPAWRVNILLQNIDLLDAQAVREIARRFPTTVTTAHKRYADAATERRLGLPVRHLGVFISAEQYERRAFAQKEDVLVVSPDPHPAKAGVLEAVAARHPGAKQVVVRNLAYEDFKNLVARAKWSVTFGEGLDGYFIEEILSGGLGFAVYNERFFTPDFKGLPTVYGSFDEMRERMPADLARLNNALAYEEAQTRLFEACSRHYRWDEYVDRLRRFYEDVRAAGF